MIRLAALVPLLVALAGCRDVARFSTAPGESYCGGIVEGPFVRTGFGPGTRMRMTLDADALAERPGVVATSDGLLQDQPLRAIPELSHDPLSTLQFGEGHVRDLVLAVDPTDPAAGPTLLAVVSLLHDGDAEVRLLRGAPPPPDARAVPAVNGAPVFGVFPLRREAGRCGF
jgi:hypothetical protein